MTGHQRHLRRIAAIGDRRIPRSVAAGSAALALRTARRSHGVHSVPMAGRGGAPSTAAMPHPGAATCDSAAPRPLEHGATRLESAPEETL